MHIDVLDRLGAAAGGFLGVTFGALVAFVFTCFAVVIGTGNPDFLNNIAFGPFFGPPISFAAGLGALAYAYRRVYIKSGRDIVTPLVRLGRPVNLLVGGVFGIFGYVVQQIVLVIPGFGTKTDSVATTVVISAPVARVVFGKSGMLGKHADGVVGWKRFTLNAQHAWLAYQQSPFMALLLGLFVGDMSSWSSVTLLRDYPNAPGVIYLGFGISAISLLFLASGVGISATHHITLVPAVFVGAFMGRVAGGDPVVVMIGAGIGALTGLVGESFSRFWLIRGDTHIDPPASAIWPMNRLVTVAAALLLS